MLRSLEILRVEVNVIRSVIYQPLTWVEQINFNYLIRKKNVKDRADIMQNVNYLSILFKHSQALDLASRAYTLF